jgi:hypothetical protein
MELDIELLTEIITDEVLKVIQAKIKNLQAGNTIDNVNTAEKAEVKVSKKTEVIARVICMEDLRQLNAQVLELEKGSIITPLAKDYLQEKKIRLIYK